MRRRGRRWTAATVGVAVAAASQLTGCTSGGSGGGSVLTRQYGLSAQGRPLLVTIVGDAGGERILVLGCLHGNECGAAPIVEELARRTPPAGTGYFLVEHPNPDGEALGTRTNANGVDLNRNFEGWRSSTPDPLHYSGPGALSEPESAALASLILERAPTAVVSYHQALNLVDWTGEQSRASAERFATDTGLPLQQTTAYPGSLATWLGTRHPEIRVLTVELPRPVPADLAARNVAAVEHLAG